MHGERQRARDTIDNNVTITLSVLRNKNRSMYQWIPIALNIICNKIRLHNETQSLRLEVFDCIALEWESFF